jgi:Na+-translocating ferredoxin:NAD+ oxidoreductase subunit C
LFGTYTIERGILLPAHKNRTAHLAIEPLPAPERLVVPLLQHQGSPARPVVAAGARVLMGQLIAEPADSTSAAMHSPVSGTVVSIGLFAHPQADRLPAIEIENDGRDERAPASPAMAQWQTAAPADICRAVERAGVVGMGSAGHPTHVRLSLPAGRAVETLVINGAESEPSLAADHRLMVEHLDEVLTGGLILGRALSATRIFVALQLDRRDIVKTVAKRLTSEPFTGMRLAKLLPRYPAGNEKVLATALTRREVPSGGGALDIGCAVFNVATARAVWNAVVNGTPLYERVITVGGPAVAEPRNLLVRVGTPLRVVLAACKADLGAAAKVVMGGPMTGLAQADLNTPVVKWTTAVTALDSCPPSERACACIGCGSCVKYCPMRLVPAALAKYVAVRRVDDVRNWGVNDCIECGCCAWVCPSKINLVHYLKLGKHYVAADSAGNS